MRSQLLMGRRAVFRPGWDCHGLPIEQQVEKELGKDARASWAPAEFRERCHAHALKFVDVMRAEFKRLGCLGAWDDPYLTLSQDYEATIVRQLAGFARARPHLPRQEAGALVRRAPHGAGRGRGRVRGAHLAVDLRALPDRRATLGKAERGLARPARPRSSSGRRRPGRCPPTWRSSPTPSSSYVAHPVSARRRARASDRRRGPAPRAFLAATRIEPPERRWIRDPARRLRDAA